MRNPAMNRRANGGKSRERDSGAARIESKRAARSSLRSIGLLERDAGLGLQDFEQGGDAFVVV